MRFTQRPGRHASIYEPRTIAPETIEPRLLTADPARETVPPASVPEINRAAAAAPPADMINSTCSAGAASTGIIK